LSRFIVVLSLNCLCANLAYGLQELNKTYLLTYLILKSDLLPRCYRPYTALQKQYQQFVIIRVHDL